MDAGVHRDQRVGLVKRPRGQLKGALRTERPKEHLLRGVFSVVGTFATFAALARIPIADFTAIAFASPLITVIFAAVFLKEKVHAYRWSAVAFGFCGVILMLMPYFRDHAALTASMIVGILFALIILGAAAIGGGWFWLNGVYTAEGPATADGKPRAVSIAKGAGSGAIATKLKEAGAIADENQFKLALRIQRRLRRLSESGERRLPLLCFCSKRTRSRRRVICGKKNKKGKKIEMTEEMIQEQMMLFEKSKIEAYEMMLQDKVETEQTLIETEVKNDLIEEDYD